jgi:hypothetical protein
MSSRIPASFARRLSSPEAIEKDERCSVRGQEIAPLWSGWAGLKPTERFVDSLSQFIDGLTVRVGALEEAAVASKGLVPWYPVRSWKGQLAKTTGLSGRLGSVRIIGIRVISIAAKNMFPARWGEGSLRTLTMQSKIH